MDSALASSNIFEAKAKQAYSKLTANGLQGDKVAEAAQEFETVFLTAMLKPIFETVEVSEEFGGGSAEETWRELLVEEYAEEIAKSGGIGIADSVRAELLRLQEITQ
jgi:flagellar protein FlgJ